MPSLTYLYHGMVGFLFYTFHLQYACNISVFNIYCLLSLNVDESTWIHFFLLSTQSLLLSTLCSPL